MKIQLKRSNVLEGGSAKEPTPEQMEYGELAVNYNENDPSLFIKDSGNNIVKISDTQYTANDGVLLTATNFTADDTVVRTSGNQTIGGTKTFSVTTVCDETLVAKNYRETVYSLPWSAGFALNPLNGETQIVTLGGTSTPTQSNWNDGESITLFIVNTAASAIDWTTLGVIWAGGNAPDLATTGKTVIQFWKSDGSIYGALVGDVA